MTNTTNVIAEFDWGTVRVINNNAFVERTDGHMNKADVTTALAEAGYRLASAGRELRVPHMKVRTYRLATA